MTDKKPAKKKPTPAALTVQVALPADASGPLHFPDANLILLPGERARLAPDLAQRLCNDTTNAAHLTGE